LLNLTNTKTIIMDPNRHIRRPEVDDSKPVSVDKPSDMGALVSGLSHADVSARSKTFTFDSVEQKILKDERGFKYNKLEDAVKYKQKLYKEGDQIFFCTEREHTLRAPYSNGLMGTIFKAYSSHIPLILRPDDLWLCICVVFGNYVSTHSEEMRSCFVQFEGQKQLTVKAHLPYMEGMTENHWCGFLAEMEKQIRSNVTPGITEWLAPNFSTTTYRDRVASNVVLMGALKEYFACRMMCCCGFPQITLEGMAEDWNLLIEKAKYLYTFGIDALSKWADLLIPVLTKFEQAYNGQIDEEFWQRACTYRSKGSGGQKDFRGWFLVFSPFDEDGKYLLNPKDEVDSTHLYGEVADDDIMDCMIHAPITIEGHTSECGKYANFAGKRYECTLFAGMMMSEYDEQSNTLRPTVDWGVIINPPITYDSMIDRIGALYYGQSEYYRNQDCTLYLPYINDLLPFAFSASKFFNFPQDSLYELTSEIFDFCTAYGEGFKQNMSNYALYSAFLIKLGNKPEWYKHDVRDFTKYVVLDEISDAIEHYDRHDRGNLRLITIEDMDRYRVIAEAKARAARDKYEAEQLEARAKDAADRKVRLQKAAEEKGTVYESSDSDDYGDYDSPSSV